MKPLKKKSFVVTKAVTKKHSKSKVLVPLDLPVRMEKEIVSSNRSQPNNLNRSPSDSLNESSSMVSPQLQSNRGNTVSYSQATAGSVDIDLTHGSIEDADAKELTKVAEDETIFELPVRRRKRGARWATVLDMTPRLTRSKLAKNKCH